MGGWQMEAPPQSHNVVSRVSSGSDGSCCSSLPCLLSSGGPCALHLGAAVWAQANGKVELRQEICQFGLIQQDKTHIAAPVVHNQARRNQGGGGGLWSFG